MIVPQYMAVSRTRLLNCCYFSCAFYCFYLIDFDLFICFYLLYLLRWVEFKASLYICRPNYRLVLSGGFRLGPGATGPPNLAQPPKFLTGFRDVLGVYRRTRVYAVYQPLVFFDSVQITNYLICHNKTGYTGIYALTVNKRMCTAPCHTKLLNFFPCTFCLACKAYRGMHY